MAVITPGGWRARMRTSDALAYEPRRNHGSRRHARMDDLQAKIDKRADRIDARAAADDAAWAEDEAAAIRLSRADG